MTWNRIVRIPELINDIEKWLLIRLQQRKNHLVISKVDQKKNKLNLSGQ